MDTRMHLIHNRYAPFWAAGMLILGVAGLSAIWWDLGSFFKGYLLDMAGPAWNYILFRGLFTSYTENAWTRFFTPISTLLIFTVVCFSIEGMQYFKLYDSTFDPWDFAAYISFLLPLFILDSVQTYSGKMKVPS